MPTGEDWHYDGERYEQVTALRRAEQTAMRGLRRRRPLPDGDLERSSTTHAGRCGRCAACTGPRFGGALDREMTRPANDICGRARWCSSREDAPPTRASRREDPPRCAPNRAARSAGPATAAGIRSSSRVFATASSPTSSSLRARLVRGWSPNPAPEWACAVPSLRAPTLVAGFAQRLASVLELPLLPLVERVVDSPPQREMRNASQQLENVLRAFKVSEVPPATPGLLVDDVRFSGWTLAVIGGQLRAAGSGPVYPLASPASAPSWRTVTRRAGRSHHQPAQIASAVVEVGALGVLFTQLIQPHDSGHEELMTCGRPGSPPSTPPDSGTPWRQLAGVEISVFGGTYETEVLPLDWPVYGLAQMAYVCTARGSPVGFSTSPNHSSRIDQPLSPSASRTEVLPTCTPPPNSVVDSPEQSASWRMSVSFE